jgi:hypothetical protein
MAPFHRAIRVGFKATGKSAQYSGHGERAGWPGERADVCARPQSGGFTLSSLRYKGAGTLGQQARLTAHATGMMMMMMKATVMVMMTAMALVMFNFACVCVRGARAQPRLAMNWPATASSLDRSLRAGLALRRVGCARLSGCRFDVMPIPRSRSGLVGGRPAAAASEH